MPSNSAPLYGLYAWSSGVLDEKKPSSPTVSMCCVSSVRKCEAISWSHRATELSLRPFLLRGSFITSYAKIRGSDA